MTRLKRILVAYDGSHQSMDALRWAKFIHRYSGAELIAIKIFEPFKHTRGGAGEVTAEHAAAEYSQDLILMENVQKDSLTQGIELVAQVLTGNVAQTLLEYARQHGVDMIVAGTRGLGLREELLLGSVAGKLISLAPVPVLVVKNYRVQSTLNAAADSGALHKIVVAYDGSLHSRRALDWAIYLCRVTGAQIAAVKVFEPSQLSMLGHTPEETSYTKMADRLAELAENDAKILDDAEKYGRSQGAELLVERLKGDVTGSLLQYARSNSADMLIAGTRGHSVAEGLLLGSVTRSLVSLSSIPILVVKG